VSHTVVIANPAAAAGRVGRERASLAARVEAALGPCRYVETRASGHAVELARKALEEGAARVLSLGGDGTHHEVVNGLLGGDGATDVAFGILPAGTGGDLRRTLGVMTFDAALAALRDRTPKRVDVGVAEFSDAKGAPARERFVNLASCGMSGLVDRLVNGSSKRLGGTASFLAGTLRALAQYKPARVRVAADGRDLGEHEVSLVVVGNGRYAGGGMCFCPEARMDDGALDLVIVPHAGLWRSAVRVPRLYRGTVAELPEVITARVREVRVERVERDAWLDLDGESPGGVPVTFRVEPSALLLAGAP
jgi:diacylglycerol kinase (ATP)